MLCAGFLVLLGYMPSAERHAWPTLCERFSVETLFARLDSARNVCMQLIADSSWSGSMYSNARMWRHSSSPALLINTKAMREVLSRGGPRRNPENLSMDQ